MAASSSTGTNPTLRPGDPAELDALAAELEAAAPPPPPAPAALPPGAPSAETAQDAPPRPRVEVHEKPQGDADQEAIEALLGDPERLEAKLSELGEEDVSDVLQLGFGLYAEGAGPHWELADPRARRLAKWGVKVLRRHPDLLPWLRENLPETMFGVLLAWEILQKLKADRQAKRAAGSAPRA